MMLSNPVTLRERGSWWLAWVHAQAGSQSGAGPCRIPTHCFRHTCEVRISPDLENLHLIASSSRLRQEVWIASDEVLEILTALLILAGLSPAGRVRGPWLT